MPTYTGTNNNDNRSIGLGKRLKWTMYGKDGHDTLTGGLRDDKIYGQVGNDKLYGRDGNDILNGGTGADTMTGGNDDDTYYVDNLRDKIVEAAEYLVPEARLLGYPLLYKDISGIDKVYSSVSNYRMPQNVEKLFLINGALNAYGNAQDNEMTGNSANNRLYANSGGDDKLFGMGGDDILFVGHGSSEVDGGSGTDTFIYRMTSAETSASLENEGFKSFDSTGKVASATLLNVEKATLIGSSTGDAITVTNSIDATLSGLGGNDFVTGGAGDDTLHGGDDHDSLIGNLGSDVLDGGRGNDTLVGATGSANTTDNNLLGAGTIDKLIGGLGNDVFVLGNNARAFYNDGNLFNQGLSDFASIQDFNRSEDKIRLHGNASDYRLGAVTVGSESGVGIYLTNAYAGESDELVGLVKGQNSMSLTANYIEYI